MAQMAGIVQQLQNERERMAKELRQIDTALAALSGSGGKATGQPDIVGTGKGAYRRRSEGAVGESEGTAEWYERP